MVLLTTNPISELVWSQREGLAIRPTISSLGERKASLFWSTESFSIVISSSAQHQQGEGNGEDAGFVRNGEEMKLQVTEDNMSVKRSAHKSVSDVLPENLIRHSERDSRSCGEINLMQKPSQSLNEKKAINTNTNININCELDEEEEMPACSIRRSTDPNFDKCVSSGPGTDNGCGSAQPSPSYQNKSIIKVANSQSSRFVQVSDHVSDKKNLQEIGRRKNPEKGKEKVLCESDDSNESVESTGCIILKGKRPLDLNHFTDSQINSDSGRKRLKKDSNDSSFMNWVSTIANGLSLSNQPAPLTIVKQSSIENGEEKIVPVKPVGFGSLFHALYRQNISISSKSLCSNENLRVGSEKIGPSEVQNGNIIEKKEENNGWACVIRNMGSSNSLSNEESRSKSNDDREKGNPNENGGFLGNFWITRLLPKAVPSGSKPNENVEKITMDLNKEPENLEKRSYEDGSSEKKDKMVKSNIIPILPSNKLKESETIASLFARRLGAIRHAKPTNISDSTNNNENNNNNNERIIKSPNKDRRMILWLGDTVCTRQLDRELSSGENGDNRTSREIGSSSSENCTKQNGIVKPNYSLLTREVNDELGPDSIFEMVRRLRLSRMDVIRWLKSPVHYANLGGFFVRLKLGKCKEELGINGYHVAHINGVTGENSLSVSIGSFRCVVESQSISNQDFLEDELRAWLSGAVKGKCRLPSREELDNKIKERDQYLGR